MELKEQNTRQDLIIRQSCLKSAVELLKDNTTNTNKVLHTAGEFEKWIKR